MVEILKIGYQKLRFIYHRMQFYYTINWTKTLYFNFKKFPFEIAKKVPVYFYGKVKLHDISGEIRIEAPIRSGMIGFGQAFETISRSQGIAEIYLMGRMVCKGHVHFGKDFFIFIGKKASCEMGHMFGMGARGKLICYDRIVFGEYVRIGFESQLMDSNFHQMLDTETEVRFPMTAPIQIGNFNWIGNRSSVMSNTITPNRLIVASNSLCNKDYSNFGENNMIGGIPAKLLKTNISRDWEGEKEDMNRWLIV